MNNQNIAICGLRYGKTKAQAEQIKKYIEENSLTKIKITIVDSESKQKLDKINEIVSSYGIQTIPSGLGECPVEVPACELNNIYKLSIIGGE